MAKAVHLVLLRLGDTKTPNNDYKKIDLCASCTYNPRHYQSVTLLKELQIKKEWKPSKGQSCICN